MALCFEKMYREDFCSRGTHFGDMLPLNYWCRFPGILKSIVNRCYKSKKYILILKAAAKRKRFKTKTYDELTGSYFYKHVRCRNMRTAWIFI